MRPEKRAGSLTGRLLSLEGALALAGLYFLAAGLAGGRVVAVFWGGMILAGLAVLALVRKKDWQAHWEEMERRLGRQGARRDGSYDDREER